MTQPINNTTLFYSWQSDEDAKLSRLFIKQSLAAASAQLATTNIVIDEALDRSTGFVNMIADIFDKISNCDIFACDISPVTYFKEKAVPNSNVLIELGYAIAMVGMDRVVAICRKDLYTKNLPFDINTRHIVFYEATESGKVALTNELAIKIQAIVIRNPPKTGVSLTSLDVKKRIRDVEFLKSLFKILPVKLVLSGCILSGNDIRYESYNCLTSFESFLTEEPYHVYDKELNAKIDELKVLISEIIRNVSSAYSFDGSRKYLKWNRPTVWNEDVYNEKNDMRLKALCKIEEFRCSFKDLIRFVKCNYLEIELEEPTLPS